MDLQGGRSRSCSPPTPTYVSNFNFFFPRIFQAAYVPAGAGLAPSPKPQPSDQPPAAASFLSTPYVRRSESVC